MGYNAREFARLLHRAGQSIWQVLPLNPTDNSGFSPYSALSAMAGNTLLISPDCLVEDGLLHASDLKAHALPQQGKADFKAARIIKDKLLAKAYDKFNDGDFPPLKAAFDQFCEAQAWWLDDWAAFIVQMTACKGKPWYEWPEKYKNRSEGPSEEQMRREKWTQFIFERQWQGLKAYCHSLGIRIFGDLPFYVSYNSVDVWANKELFRLGPKGEMISVAGVPPDYFNDEGQLWGMPIYDWEQLKQTRYNWWVQRIRRNMEWFDLLRLDHFRAFAAYWEVPAGEKTAKKGEWVKGPGNELFRLLQKEMKSLPLVAEDLGEITDDVYALRDKFQLPGMKVLQFAFGEDMGTSPHIPHHHAENFLVYTGTHDNNTSKGWYFQDMDRNGRRRLNQYTGRRVADKDAHLVLCRLAYSSIAKTAILPMQDVLGLDGSARMNKPADTGANWLWRMLPGQFSETVVAMLKEWTLTYGRSNCESSNQKQEKT
ncbi:4-alpha-glucanotransferase [Chitinophaga horti]|uniref:4-alpha-glucanotransferase n=1 Tax=Chitinophaga horti TaxID=2920382 RepID=A0ABY6J8K1_9BACT|nr:4-alpha-glucanotransferase [Chitinophaga horti]UYQ95968.1 4-alpha-glucanotransferase [Chitinophaga horti]